MATVSDPQTPSRALLPAIAAVGVSATITQLVLLREMLGALAGNELVLGVVLANWLLLTGLGASAGRWGARLRQPLGWFVALQTLLAVLPFAQIVALRLGRDTVFGHGTTVGLAETVLASFLLLLPYCLTSGFLLTLGCGMAAAARQEPRPPLLGRDEVGREGEPPGEPRLSPHAPDQDSARAIARIYIADGLGSVLGGVLFSLVLVHFLDHFALLAVPALLNLALAAWLARSAAGVACAVPAHRSRDHALAWSWPVPAAIALGLVALFAFLRPDAWLTQHQFPGQEIVFRGQSPYGRLVVTGSAGQPRSDRGELTFRENGVPLFSTRQIDQAEETVHFALAQRPHARRILLIGGGVAGTVAEARKYQPESVTYVELDPLVLTAGRQFVPESLADPRLRVVTTDGRRFVQTTTDQFDVVILDVPEPVTLQYHRLYTIEFFRELRRVLTPDGVAAFAVGRYENYLSPEIERVLACAGATARAVFPNVLVLPGARVWFLASAGELTTDIAGRLEAHGIPTKFIQRHALTAILTPDRLAAVGAAAAVAAPVNEDFRPRLLARRLAHWLGEFSPGPAVLALLVLVVPTLFLIRWRVVPLAVCAGGFTAAALEVVLLLAFQVLYGSVYYQLGIIVTVFMAGLAAGAWLAIRFPSGEEPESGGEGPPPSDRRATLRRRPSPSLRWVLPALVLALAILAAALPLTLGALRATPAGVGQVLFALVTFVLAAIVGAEFPVAARLGPIAPGLTAARLYAADFAGASLGALLASTVLVPLAGVTTTCAVAAALNIIALVGLVVARRR